MEEGHPRIKLSTVSRLCKVRTHTATTTTTAAAAAAATTTTTTITTRIRLGPHSDSALHISTERVNV